MRAIPTLRLQPAAITEIGARQLIEAHTQVLARHQAGDLDEDVSGASRILDVAGPVAIIHVKGPLFRSDNWISHWCGWATYDAIWEALEVATSDKNIGGILLNVNSPGGFTNGLAELADHLRSVAGRMEVWAHADNMMASAAYWLGSQATHIVGYTTAEIGCIGTRCTVIDDGEWLKSMGITIHDLVNEQSPDKRGWPIDEDVIKRLVTALTDNASIFISSVAAARGTDEKTVIEKFGKGDVMIAKKAVDVGMIDEIASFGDTLAALQKTVSAKSKGRTSMPDPRVASALRAEAKNDDPIKCAKCSEPMHNDAEHYCKGCYESEHDEPDGDEDEDGDEEARALKAAGLLGAKRSETRQNLIVFARGMLALTGTASAAEATGAVQAGLDAKRTLREHEERAKEQAKEQSQAEMARLITEALASSKLTLGRIGEALDFLAIVGDAAEVGKARAELGATVDDKAGKMAAPRTREAALAAFAKATWSPRDCAAMASWLGTKAPTLPSSSPREPSSTPAARAVVSADIAKSAEAAGLPAVLADEQAGSKPKNVFSIASIREAAAKKGA